jgi:hypothetical protein
MIIIGENSDFSPIGEYVPAKTAGIHANAGNEQIREQC